MKYSLVFIAFLLASCGSGSSTVTTTQTDSTANKQVPATPHRDTVTITERSALFFSPDSLQIEKAKHEGPEEDFYTAADDYVYYTSEAGMYFDSVKLKSIHIQGEKVLRFVQANGTTTAFDLDTIQDLWGIYLFDPSKPPRFADILDAKEEYENYFNNRATR
jgi:sugar/nucleoside kinase (ribokinase family)